jgi:hypothetical protein
MRLSLSSGEAIEEGVARHESELEVAKRTIPARDTRA